MKCVNGDPYGCVWIKDLVEEEEKEKKKLMDPTTHI